MHELSRRVARMKLLGVAAWDKEDYELAYAIKNGIVKLPQKALFDPDAYKLDGDGPDGNAKAINRGLFNVHRYTAPRKDYFQFQDPFPQLPVTEGNTKFSGWGGRPSGGFVDPLDGTS